jgi:hypothetical protein
VAAIVAEQAVVADFGEAPGEQMEAQTADELDTGQGQGFEAAGIGVILVSEGEGAGAGVEGAQAAVGDMSDAFGVSTAPAERPRVCMEEFCPAPFPRNLAIPQLLRSNVRAIVPLVMKGPTTVFAHGRPGESAPS